MGATISERDFEIELLAYCEMWHKKNINADNIVRGIDEFKGAIATATWYVLHDTEGLARAVERLGCRYTIEWLVARSDFAVLFEDHVVERAEAKLQAAGC